MAFYSDANFTHETSVGYLVRRVHQLGWTALDPIFAEAGITATQWQALASIHQQASTCAEVARDLCHDKGATTRLVDTLEERGWITRTRGPGDRRLVHLALTAAGEAIATRVRDAVIDSWNLWLADWTEKDINDLLRLLQRLRNTLQQPGEGRAA